MGDLRRDDHGCYRCTCSWLAAVSTVSCLGTGEPSLPSSARPARGRPYRVGLDLVDGRRAKRERPAA